MEDTENLTESQSERQWPQLDGSMELIAARNLFVFQGSQLDIAVSLDLGRYQGTHWVTLEARPM